MKKKNTVKRVEVLNRPIIGLRRTKRTRLKMPRIS